MAKHLFTSETAPRNGRPKGAKNRTTEEIRQYIQMVMDNNLERLEDDLERMSPSHRWQTLEKLTKYFLPALSKNDNNNTLAGGLDINVVFQDLDYNHSEKKKELDQPAFPNYLAVDELHMVVKPLEDNSL